MLTLEWVGPELLRVVAGTLLITGSACLFYLIYTLYTWEVDWRPRGDEDE